MIIADLLGELVSGGEEVHLVSGAEQSLESEVDGIRLGALTILPVGDERFPQELELVPLHFRKGLFCLAAPFLLLAASLFFFALLSDVSKKGSKVHVLSDAQGVPLTRRRVRREHARQPRPQASHPRHPRHPVSPGPRRRRPVKIRADKAYFAAEQLAWLRERGRVGRIAGPGVDSGERLGRYRWKIERSIAWLFGYRR
ncbi:hypothetical protein [Streptomyces sp. CA2R101]|uniref:hypothetical protein n=1 Tax=Streptomyces sp. CA2R101 TaxID=3120152 RepID=UPI00300A033E